MPERPLAAVAGTPRPRQKLRLGPEAQYPGFGVATVDGVGAGSDSVLILLSGHPFLLSGPPILLSGHPFLLSGHPFLLSVHPQAWGLSQWS